MTWFTGAGSYGKVLTFLTQLTDPYLNFFRRIKFFQFGPFDFSPVLALIILSVAGNVFLSLAAFKQVTFGLVLALLVMRLWAAIAFFLSMYIFLTAMRLVGLIARFNSASPFWRYVDMILNPVLVPLVRLIFRRRNIPYLTGLMTGGILLLVLRFFGAILIDRLAILIMKIPF
jgi:YggT family protein